MLRVVELGGDGVVTSVVVDGVVVVVVVDVVVVVVVEVVVGALVDLSFGGASTVESKSC